MQVRNTALLRAQPKTQSHTPACNPGRQHCSVYSPFTWCLTRGVRASLHPHTPGYASPSSAVRRLNMGSPAHQGPAPASWGRRSRLTPDVGAGASMHVLLGYAEYNGSWRVYCENSKRAYNQEYYDTVKGMGVSAAWDSTGHRWHCKPEYQQKMIEGFMVRHHIHTHAHTSHMQAQARTHIHAVRFMHACIRPWLSFWLAVEHVACVCCCMVAQ